MDLEFSDEQRAIGELATAIFRDFASDDRLRELDAQGSAHDEKLWRQLADAGLTAMLNGDAGLGMVEAMVVLEAQGRSASRAPLWRQMLSAALIDRFAPSLGAAVLAPDSDLSRLSAVEAGGGWTVEGEIDAVAGAREAALLIAPVVTSSGRRFFAIPLDAAEHIAEGLLTDGEPVTDLMFRSLSLADDACLPVEVESWLAPRAVACLIALQLGVAEEALARTAAYVTDRRQFGRPIGSFQAVMVRAADAYCDVEALRGAVWRLCAAIDSGTVTPGDIEVAKIWAADCGHRVAHAAQHLHGGLGADLSYPLHRFYLRARAIEMTLGGSLAHRKRLGAWLADIAEPNTVFVDA